MTDMLTEDELDELEALERGATPGEWRVDDPDGDRDWIATVPENRQATFGRLWQFSLPSTSSPTGRLYADCPSTNEHDALLLVALRNAAPRLLAEIRTLRDQNAWLVQREEEREAELRECVQERDRLMVELARLQQAKPHITADMVKEVRERGGNGLLRARACLEATGGDVEKAVEMARRGGGG